MSIISPRSTLRWKEWIPLVTQQQRLRNLIQIIGYNINVSEKCPQAEKSPRKKSYYYTLHLTTMSAPFYTSEKLESDNPKWADIEIKDVNGTAAGVVIRVWWGEQVVSVWGVSLSGLLYLGPRLAGTDPSQFTCNALLLHMQGGYFTPPQCLKDQRPGPLRQPTVTVNAADIRPSYSVSLLLKLHSIQQAIKQHSVAAAALRERIVEGDLRAAPDQTESAMVRRLLSRTRGNAPRLHHQLSALRQRAEEARLRVQLLSHERDRVRACVRQRVAQRDKMAEENQDKDMELMEKYRVLHKEVERLKELKRTVIDTKENLVSIKTMLQALIRKRISELNIIYPISQEREGRHTICGVYLPNSEEFAGEDEVMIAVALGYVAHLLQMIACFLNVPLRYPVVHGGSRSKVLDLITEKIPDKDREFPLFLRSKDRLQFDYGVYLMNKNVAQLRWLCGLATADLRATLPNLLPLLNLRPASTPAGLEAAKRALSSSTLELQEGGPLRPWPRPRLSPLSYSLDKGLDRIDGRRVRTLTQTSEPVEPPVSSEEDGLRAFPPPWTSERHEQTHHDDSGDSLASIINRINSPHRELDSAAQPSIRQVTTARANQLS